ncbi:TPA: hypothetical protein ACQFL4_003036 [Proteus mirabilis]
MKTLLLGLFFVFSVSGCTSTNPPDAPEAKGQWIEMTTTLTDMQG